MRWIWSFLYASLWIVFVIFTLTFFDRWNTQVLIPIFPLIGIGAWLYGRTTGYVLVLIAAIFHFVIASFLHGHDYSYYEDRLTGALLGICIAYLVGRLRKSYDDLKETNVKLDHRIEERSTELNHLTVKLINDAEATRIRHGQVLHDGIGQQLTGIQLYCTSLAEQLVEESNPIASLAFSMRASAEKAHNIIRKTARMLFPVRMQETGLMSAVNELVSCLSEMKNLSIDAELQGDFDDIPDNLGIALYRICHESALCAVTELNASAIQLDLSEGNAGYQVALLQNGTSWSKLQDTIEQRLILYRLQSLGGMVTIDSPNKIIYRIPKVA